MINKNYKTYILCPAYVETGGPESLHLLCHTLRNKNIECYMVYTNEGPYKKGHPGHGVIDSSTEWMDHIILNGKPNGYQQYNTLSTIEIEDSPNNTIIIPEIYFQYPPCQMIPLCFPIERLQQLVLFHQEYS